MLAVEITQFSYTWLDEKQEVLYGMRFVDRDDFDKIISNMYITGSSLYITPNPVIVNTDDGGGFYTENKVKEGVYGHVLWWINNEVRSQNITLIAWKHIVVEDNDNATLLWWDNNTFWSGWRTPMVVVWWSENTIWYDHDGVALIWWKDNHIRDNVSNSFILWWENNIIQDDRNNVIVWWKNVTVDEDDVFVYSNSDTEFNPDTSNAFYLNVENGVGINTAPSNRGLAVKGAVNLGEINITEKLCLQ